MPYGFRRFYQYNYEYNNSAFAQGLRVLKYKPNFTAADFTDINAINAFDGGTLLHSAVRSFSKTNVNRLLDTTNANPLIKDNLGRTPLKLSILLGQESISKTLISHALTKEQTALFKSDFYFYKMKGDGISKGGFYKDNNDAGWLLKEGHADNPKAVVREYVAGGLFQTILGQNAPQTEIVINAREGTFWTGSKLLDNFSTLYDSLGWNEFSFECQGKPVENLLDVVISAKFMGDRDTHSQNIGLIEYADHFDVAKIDHGFAFHFSDNITLNNIRYELNSHYGISNIESLGFDAVYQAINSVTGRDFSYYSDVVNEKMDDVNVLGQALQLTNIRTNYDEQNKGDFSKSVDKYKAQVISGLKLHYDDLQDIADYMQLEKAIIEHDAFTLHHELVINELSLSHPFDPFYNYGDYHWSKLAYQTTGNELLLEHWPGLYDAIQAPDKPIMIGDIFSDTPVGNVGADVFGAEANLIPPLHHNVFDAGHLHHFELAL